MATPVQVFADAAARYGGVDPHDIEAVQNWFAEELPKLELDQIERLIEDLLAADGSVPDRKIAPVYPQRAPLPSLSSSPRLDAPLLAEHWSRLLPRLAARLRNRR